MKNLNKKIEKYLEERERWRYFINEKGMDLENSTVVSITVDVDVDNENNGSAEAFITILYELLEGEETKQCENSVIVTLNEGREIKAIERVPSSFLDENRLPI